MRCLSDRQTWPDLRVTLHLLPWTWRLKPWLYVDDVGGALGHCHVSWLFFQLDWYGQDGGWKSLFFEEPITAGDFVEPAGSTFNTIPAAEHVERLKALILNAPIMFWSCPRHDEQKVEWASTRDGRSIPVCLTRGCTGELQ